MWPLVALALAAADPAPLRWDASAPGCPDAQSVDALLQPLLSAQPAPIRAHARVQPSGPAWRAELTLQWQGRVDTRRVEAEDCTRLAEAIVLLVAVMADPVQATARIDRTTAPARVPPPLPTPPRAPPPVTVPSPEVPSPEPPPADATRRAREGDRGASLGVAILVDGGTLPSVTPGPLLGVTWRRPWVRLFAEGMLLPPRRVVALDPAAQGQLVVGAARLGACLRIHPGRRVELPLCGGAELGATAAIGFETPRDPRSIVPRTRTRHLWSAMLARASVHVSIGPMLALTASAEIAGPLRRFEYRYDDATLHTTAPLAVRGILGVEVRLPSRKPPRPENP